MKINGVHHRTIWLSAADNTKVEIIDQRQLPHRLAIVSLANVEDVYEAIKKMLVRGAGLIGATAGYGMYLASLEVRPDHFFDDLKKTGDYLKTARPTARNLGAAVDRVLQAVSSAATVAEMREKALFSAETIADEDAEFCRRIGIHGLALIEKIWLEKNKRPVNILTHCNAGWLAFVDFGSATAPIYAARDHGLDIHVWVDETRPWNQGAKLTAWELQQEHIPNTLITDNAGGHLMQNGLVDLVIVGTDRTTRSGDVANKIGTYLKALAAQDNGIPFYVALPSTTFDWELDNGADIPIEQRAGDEITTITGLTKDDIIETVQLTAPGTRAVNYSFDVTPARLISALITERGVVKAEKKAIQAMFPDHCPISDRD